MPGKCEMPGEEVLLDREGREIVKAVEAGFSQGTNTWVMRASFHRVPVLGASLLRVVRMNAGTGKDAAKLVGNSLGGQRTFGRRRNAQNGRDAGSAARPMTSPSVRD